METGLVAMERPAHARAMCTRPFLSDYFGTCACVKSHNCPSWRQFFSTAVTGPRSSRAIFRTSGSQSFSYSSLFLADLKLPSVRCTIMATTSGPVSSTPTHVSTLAASRSSSSQTVPSMATILRAVQSVVDNSMRSTVQQVDSRIAAIFVAGLLQHRAVVPPHRSHRPQPPLR